MTCLREMATITAVWEKIQYPCCHSFSGRYIVIKTLQFIFIDKDTNIEFYDTFFCYGEIRMKSFIKFMEMDLNPSKFGSLVSRNLIVSGFFFN